MPRPSLGYTIPPTPGNTTPLSSLTSSIANVRNLNFDETEKGKNYICRERKYGKFERSFYLGDLKTDDVEASFENGTLKIRVPKIEESKDKKRIEIK